MGPWTKILKLLYLYVSFPELVEIKKKDGGNMYPKDFLSGFVDVSDVCIAATVPW